MPLDVVRATIASPAFRHELRAVRREALEAVQASAVAVVSRGLGIVHRGMEKDPDNTDLALAAIGKASVLLPRQVEIERIDNEADSDVADQVAWLLQQADAHRLQLEMGSAAVLDAELVANDEGPLAEASGPYDDLL